MKKILVLQHEAHEGIGAWEILFQNPNYQVVIKKLFEGEKVPLEEEICEFQGVILMGGGMSANDAHKFPFIADELKLIKQAISLKIPLLGVCLGAQLIAKALNTKIYKGPQKEIGWYKMTLAPASNKDPIFGLLPSPSMIFQWHGETFDIPSGAIRLCGSALYLNQAFRYSDNVYGIQFHCEMTSSMIEDWVKKGEAEILEAGLSPQKILEDSNKYIPTLRRWANQVGQGWLKLVK